MLRSMLLAACLLLFTAGRASAQEAVIQPHLFDDLNTNLITDLAETEPLAVDPVEPGQVEDITLPPTPDDPVDPFADDQQTNPDAGL